MYGAQHGFRVLAEEERDEQVEALVVGHCCESGDILTPAPGDPEGLQPRTLPRAEVGDYCLVQDTGAYCASMSAKNYNSFPEAPELLRKLDGEWLVIRRKQELSQILANEVNERLTPELDNFRSDVS